MIPIMGKSRLGACDDRVGLSMSTRGAKKWLQVFSFAKTNNHGSARPNPRQGRKIEFVASTPFIGCECENSPGGLYVAVFHQGYESENASTPQIAASMRFF
jgi:hypothetical protein